MMASIQNGYKESPPPLEEDMLSPIKNGNKDSPPQLADDVVKVVVIGERQCGKTRFIRTYYDNHFPGEMYSHNGVRVYECQYHGYNQHRRVSIFEIPADSNYVPEQRLPHYEEADFIVFMYAIDDQTSYGRLADKWIPEALDSIDSNRTPVAFVGNKIDLLLDQQVIERLAAENQSFVTVNQTSEMLDVILGSVVIMECSAYDLNLVENAFNTIFAYVLLTD